MLRLEPILISCEHAGNRVPAPYRTLFQGARDSLDSHQGYDPGALSLAKSIAQRFSLPLFIHRSTRLLVDVNRSLGHPSLFSRWSRTLSPREKQTLLLKHYHPYRTPIIQWIRRELRSKERVTHLSIHTFVPVLNGQVRRADIGLLYDPARAGESSLCREWKRVLKEIDPKLRVRMNYPYQGKSDGLVTHLRKRFSPGEYRGIELEVNQRFPTRDKAAWRGLRADLLESLHRLMAGPEFRGP